MLGDFPIRVSPSKTAIVPVNNTYLPRSTEERELVARTVFVVRYAALSCVQGVAAACKGWHRRRCWATEGCELRSRNCLASSC